MEVHKNCFLNHKCETTICLDIGEYKSSKNDWVLAPLDHPHSWKCVRKYLISVTSFIKRNYLYPVHQKTHGEPRVSCIAKQGLAPNPTGSFPRLQNPDWNGPHWDTLSTKKNNDNSGLWRIELIFKPPQVHTNTKKMKERRIPRTFQKNSWSFQGNGTY